MTIASRLTQRTLMLAALIATLALVALFAIAGEAGSLGGGKQSVSKLSLSLGAKTVSSKPSRRR